jgi:C1A family cysteine protease
MKDDGTYIHDAIEALAEFGCCKEQLFPFVLSNLNREPPAECYAEAKNYRIKAGMQLTGDLNEMKACLAEGYPFIFSLALYESFLSAETNGGHVPVPVIDDELQDTLIGSHAMLAAGYSDRSKCFIVRNSWGEEWVSF